MTNRSSSTPLRTEASDRAESVAPPVLSVPFVADPRRTVMKKNLEARASWILAGLLLLIVVLYVALNWEAVFPAFGMFAEFFR